MEATYHMERPYRLDPCPADERVGTTYLQEQSDAGAKGGKEGEVVGDDGIHYQKCGGGRRVLRKKIGSA